METKKAKIKREESSTYLVLEVGENPIQIILTDDNPNNVKSAFNLILKELKKGLLQFELDDLTLDLYNNISSEYLKQLNAEMKTIYREIVDYELTEK